MLLTALRKDSIVKYTKKKYTEMQPANLKLKTQYQRNLLF